MIHLRYSLLSYIYSEAWKVTSKGSAMMRGTVVDFSDDRKTFDDGSQLYVWGCINDSSNNQTNVL